jgi:hypothetical protein
LFEPSSWLRRHRKRHPHRYLKPHRKGTAVNIRSVLGFIVLFVIAGASHAAWPSAHGNSDNTGFVDVDTAPAAIPTGFANVGRVADGANPVIGANGTVYIGNKHGELIALHPDGTLSWKRSVSHGGIYASPVLGANGFIYVVSVDIVSDSYGTHSYTYLHQFDTGGAYFSWVSLPVQNASLPAWANGGATTAPPNIWHFNGVEAIMVPVWYREFSNWELRLFAFSTNLGILAVQPVTLWLSGDITAAPNPGWCDPLPIPGCVDFHTRDAPPPFADANWPMPGVAIRQYAQGSPRIWVADGKRSTVAYKFDPVTGFSESYRSSNQYDRLSSPPMALDERVGAVVGTANGYLKFETNSVANVVIPGFGPITAAPSRLHDGRLIVIDRSGRMSALNGRTVTMQAQLNGESIASAAASCTHVFVSSRNELVTYDIRNMMPVARVPWTEGGRYAPVIGPSGRVYAMTKFGLFVFAAPKPGTGIHQLGTACNLSFPVITIGGGLLTGNVTAHGMLQ